MKNSRLFDHLPVSDELKSLYDEFADIKLNQLFAEDPDRFDKYSLSAAGLFLDYSKNKINDVIMHSLADLTEQSGIRSFKKAMYSGDKINFTENREVLHIAARQLDTTNTNLDNKKLTEIKKTREKMQIIADSIIEKTWRGYTNKPIKHIVNIGIGGSHLGMQNVLSALEPYHAPELSYHFVANIDPTDLTSVLAKIDLESTIFIIASKSFKTRETLENAKSARDSLIASGCPENQVKHHFIAISSNLKATKEFGILKENTLPIWDWIGGRFSLWSAIGLIVAIIIGYKNYLLLLQGAQQMDKHFLNAPIKKNMPIIMAVLGVWYQNYFKAQTHAIISYDSRLAYLPEHIQQIDMESNGKQIRQDCTVSDYDTGAVIWGGVGCNSQHAYMQLIHQGTREIPIDFILPIKSHNPLGDHQQWLLANALAQSKAMMVGKTQEQIYEELLQKDIDKKQAKTLSIHKSIPGNRPSNTILIEQITPETIGALIALYEHKVFTQGIIWGINSFDQWGVELGKELGDVIMSQLSENNATDINTDCSTVGLIDKIKSYTRGR